MSNSQLARKFRDHSARPRPGRKRDVACPAVADEKAKSGSSRVCASKTKAAPMISRQMRSLAILAALALAGCTVATLNLGATDYKGKPLGDVTAKLGQPNEVQTIAGQKAYIWNVGNTL
jgi:hypothetical protein